MAVSNMPVAATRDRGTGGLASVRFAASPKMSTYLLFLAVGDFERATTRDGGDRGRRRRAARRDRPGAASRSTRRARILREYNDYFGTPYPLPKLDNVAAPGSSQFFGGDGELGRDLHASSTSLLLDPDDLDRGRPAGIFAIAAHEIAHQWFGDLVTMALVGRPLAERGLRLLDGDARRPTSSIPNGSTGLRRGAGRDEAMARDAVAATHPVVQHVETVDQASQAFDVDHLPEGRRR